jgi:hypothetical protein
MAMATASSREIEGWEVTFKADAWYSEYALRIRGWDEAVLARARKHEGLRYRQLGHARWYLGAWLEAWLRGPEAGAGEAAG